MKKLLITLGLLIAYQLINAQCSTEVKEFANAQFNSIASPSNYYFKGYKDSEEDSITDARPMGFTVSLQSGTYDMFFMDYYGLMLMDSKTNNNYYIDYPQPFGDDFLHSYDQPDDLEGYYMVKKDASGDSLFILEIRGLKFESGAEGQMATQFVISQSGYVDVFIDNAVTPFKAWVEQKMFKPHEGFQEAWVLQKDQNSPALVHCIKDFDEFRNHEYLFDEIPLGLTHYRLGQGLSTSISEQSIQELEMIVVDKELLFVNNTIRNADVEFFTLNGASVARFTNVSGKHLPLPELKSGYYMVSVTTQGQNKVKTFVIN